MVLDLMLTRGIHLVGKLVDFFESEIEQKGVNDILRGYIPPEEKQFLDIIDGLDSLRKGNWKGFDNTFGVEESEQRYRVNSLLLNGLKGFLEKYPGLITPATQSFRNAYGLI